MEYTQLDDATQRDLLRNTILQFERAHHNAELDLRKFDRLLREIENPSSALAKSLAGNKNIRQQKVKQWQQQRANYASQVVEYEMQLEDLKARVAALPEPEADPQEETQDESG